MGRDDVTDDNVVPFPVRGRTPTPRPEARPASKGPFPVRGVANALVAELRALGAPRPDALTLSHMAWICDGWSLAILERHLVSELAEPEGSGPRYAVLWENAPLEGSWEPFPDRRSSADGVWRAELDDVERDIVRRVAAKHGRQTRLELVATALHRGHPSAEAWLAGRASIGGAETRDWFERLARAGRETPTG